MLIHKITATFGKLENATLTLSPGLNVLYAANESGKSTWSALLGNLLYGLPTRDRSALADKNRFAPWSGKAMQGRMELTADGQDYTIERRTARASAPMGDFSCVFSGTATAVPGIDKGNLGETLLGVPREVFERSAMIRQSGLAVDQNAELEKRIAALITTGEEDTSYSESYQRLRSQLNSRKHNKTGRIPALERELLQLEEDIARLRALNAEAEDCQKQLQAELQSRGELERQQKLWEQAALYRQAEAYRAAQETVRACQEREALLSERAAALPDSETLEQCSGQLRAVQETAAALETARKFASEKDAAAERARAALNALPPEQTSKAPSPLLPVIGVALGLAALVFFYLSGHLLVGISVLAGLAGISLVPYLLKKNRYRAVLAAQQQLAASRGAAQRAYDDARGESMHADAAADALAQRCQAGLESVLRIVQSFQPLAKDEGGAQVALLDAKRQVQEMNDARAQSREAALRLELLAPVQAEKPAEAPQLSQEDAARRLAQSRANEKLLQSRQDTLRGQLRSLGDLAELENTAAQKREALAAAQNEYDAIALAMEVLDRANLTLQNWFSPQLGERAAAIFAGITGGRYQKVLLSRDFSIAAETADDPASRDIQLLSQGTADQLYLAVRLAICDLVLPEEKAAPLILDDALVSFDDERCRAALDYLAQEGKRRQILLFTCQSREGDYLRDRAAVQTLS